MSTMSATRERECVCRLCIRSRIIDRIVERGNVATLRALASKLHNDLGHTEDDLNHAQAILDGSWPTAMDSGIRIIETVVARMRKAGA